MMVTVFRSRLKPENADEYYSLAQRMGALAKTMPGYISHKVFIAEDGERVTVVEFADEESLKAWTTHMDHVAAKKKGRADFYREYKVQVCKVVRESTFKSEARMAANDRE